MKNVTLSDASEMLLEDLKKADFMSVAEDESDYQRVHAHNLTTVSMENMKNMHCYHTLNTQPVILLSAND